jgi:hypothetical protein
LISVATNGMCKSLCSVKLEMYRGALVMDRRIFNCSRWMICVWDGFTQPQSCIQQLGYVEGNGELRISQTYFSAAFTQRH